MIQELDIVHVLPFIFCKVQKQATIYVEVPCLLSSCPSLTNTTCTTDGATHNQWPPRGLASPSSFSSTKQRTTAAAMLSLLTPPDQRSQWRAEPVYLSIHPSCPVVAVYHALFEELVLFSTIFQWLAGTENSKHRTAGGWLVGWLIGWLISCYTASITMSVSMSASIRVVRNAANTLLVRGCRRSGSGSGSGSRNKRLIATTTSAAASRSSCRQRHRYYRFAALRSASTDAAIAADLNELPLTEPVPGVPDLKCVA